MPNCSLPQDPGPPGKEGSRRSLSVVSSLRKARYLLICPHAEGRCRPSPVVSPTGPWLSTRSTSDRSLWRSGNSCWNSSSSSTTTSKCGSSSPTTLHGGSVNRIGCGTHVLRPEGLTTIHYAVIGHSPLLRPRAGRIRIRRFPALLHAGPWKNRLGWGDPWGFKFPSVPWQFLKGFRLPAEVPFSLKTARVAK